MTLTTHGDERVDDWYWLRDKDDPEVSALLEAENAFTAARWRHTEDAAGASSSRRSSPASRRPTCRCPPRKGDVVVLHAAPWRACSTRSHCRRRGRSASRAPEQVLLDAERDGRGPRLLRRRRVRGQPRPHAAGLRHRLRRRRAVYTLRFRDLDHRRRPGRRDRRASYYGSAWAADNRTFFYTRPDDAMRPYQLWRHLLGTPPRRTTCSCTRRTTSGSSSASGRRRTSEYVVLASGAARSPTSALSCAADDPAGEFRVVEPRQQGVEYSVEHHGAPLPHRHQRRRRRELQAGARRPIDVAGPGALDRGRRPPRRT